MVSMESTSLFAIKFAREIREDGNPIAMLEARDAAIRTDDMQKFNAILRIIANTATADDIDLYQRDPVLHAAIAALRLAITQGQQEGEEK